MKTIHTPGPWFITRTESSPCSIEASGNEAAIAKVYLTDPKIHKRTPEHHANARLIAAAPDLLQALSDLTDWGRTHTSPRDANSPHHLLVAARAAIAKATV
jgi:hypothetical protein